MKDADKNNNVYFKWIQMYFECDIIIFCHTEYGKQYRSWVSWYELGKMSDKQMIHNSELHMKTLDNLCRTCGKRALSFKQKMNKKHKIRLVDKYTHLINEYFGIDTSSDSVTTHPDKLCTYCYNSLMTQKRNPNSVIHEVNRATARLGKVSYRFVVPSSTFEFRISNQLLIRHWNRTRSEYVLNKW